MYTLHKVLVLIVRFVLSFVVVIGLTSTFVSSVSAETLQSDMETLSSDLSTNSELSDFSGFSSEHQLGDERALGSVEWLEEMFTGNEMLDGDLDHGGTGPDFSQIESFLDDLKATYGSIPEGGSTDGALGAEAADLAEAGGIITAGSTSILATVPLLGYLTYEDIEDGSNIVSRALFSSQEDHANIEAQGGTAAEEVRWQFFPSCSGFETMIECTSRANHANHEKFIETGTELENYGGDNEVPHNEPRNKQYVLEPKIDGKWYPSVEGCIRGSEPGVDSSGEFPGPGQEWPTFATCYFGYDSGKVLDGWPEHLEHVATDMTFGFAQFIEREPGALCVEIEACPQTRWSIVSSRSPSRMHESLPHKISKSEAEKLESEKRCRLKVLLKGSLKLHFLMA
jgi:hypothetical protein